MMKETDKVGEGRTNLEEPMVIEEEKSQITIEKEEIIEAHTYREHNESNLGFANFADFFKNLGKKKGVESYSGTKLTKETTENAAFGGDAQKSFDCSASQD
jgi:hypothetical protein